MLLWRAYAVIYQGWAMAMQDGVGEGLALMRQRLEDLEGTGTRLHRAQCLGLLAQALGASGQAADALRSVDEALALAERQQELWFLPELYRIKGSLVVEENTKAAVNFFEQAIAVARDRQAKSWELRAATSLARLWLEQGDRNKGYELLAPIYAWFTEGFDTRDLIEAKTLLGGLR
jgi:predicted ATPase